MTRRRFFKQLGALAALGSSATAAKPALVAWKGLTPGPSTYPRGGLEPETAGIPLGPSGSRWGLWTRLQDEERIRARWYHLWRRHRCRVRRGLENRTSAKLIWLTDRLKEIRRQQARTVNSILPSHGKGFYREQARAINRFKLAGLKFPPWRP